MANLGVDLAKSLLRSLGILFSNNVDIEVATKPLFDDFGGNGVVFLLFSGLSSGGRLRTRSVYHIPDLIFFEYSLHKVSLLEPVVKVAEFLSYDFAVVVFGGHCNGGDVRG